LIEGDIVEAMGYISDRSYACLALDSPDPAAFDRGMAPFQLMMNLKSAYDSVGPHSTLTGLVVGTRLTGRGLQVVRQDHHAQFVVYEVPDDVASSFDCQNELTAGHTKRMGREYGHYYGATFYVAGNRDTQVALLWAQDHGYWKIVSWKVGLDDAATTSTTAPDPVREPKIVHVGPDRALVADAKGFLESWLVRRDYDAAFGYISPKAYACYNLERGEASPAAASDEDAGRKLRASLETAGASIGTAGRLADIVTAADPVYAATRIMDHHDSKTFTMTSIPNALADAEECAARAAGAGAPDPLPHAYGSAYGTIVHFRSGGDDGPVLRLLWRREAGAWKITAYGIERP
jgi:hypothetical protein